MPNWCQNSLEVYGKTKEDLEKLIANNCFFQNVLPIDEDKRTADYQNAVWGTKWDLCEDDLRDFQIIEVDEGCYKYKLIGNFHTAWSPPIAVFQELQDMGYDVSCAYIEYGNQYCGWYNSEYDFFLSEIPPSTDLFWEDTAEGRFIDSCLNVVEFLEEWEDDDSDEYED